MIRMTSRAHRLVRALDGVVGDHGRVQQVDSASPRIVILIVPAKGTGGVPIYLHLAGGEAIIRTGLAGRLALAWGGTDDDEHICDVVAAIVAGDAVEYCVVDDRGDLHGYLAVRGTWGEYVPGAASHSHLHWRLPQWAPPIQVGAP
ncbi:hypothetical protein [Nocardioides sp. LML1-1-1.1]|uniref:hypothetical protein n=1 Tax=Nocardioides sp. LML1-1-1.1 TaxID=3135248 RepID=UPI0034313FED